MANLDNFNVDNLENDEEFQKLLGNMDEIPEHLRKKIEKTVNFGMELMYTASLEAIKSVQGENMNFPKVPESAQKIMTAKRHRDGKKVTGKGTEIKPSRETALESNVTSSPTANKNVKLKKGQLRMEIVGITNGGKEKFLGRSVIVTPLVKSSKKPEQVQIGRSSGSQFKKFGFSIKDDYELSTVHGKIYKHNNAFIYKDSNSTNGSFLHPNDIPVGRPGGYQLKNGDMLRLGSCIIQFTF